ncbi:hypothetical protein BKA82DRAFT_914421 [Pisolithus tinctorius]|uniref:Uncharacterized protein n=1 Tax=Pisolithus tinctorius Marx 270 TaxID=870435 RepID=A0A0C3PAD4_PISTI|nr:hypothetical protein BKA82DRAFT_914421 [Pisolithus tinctorius]KIO10580.1 hypothetical protein M404DRAFT_914421 [Pisolithus tinctorius Marx 270]
MQNPVSTAMQEKLTGEHSDIPLLNSSTESEDSTNPQHVRRYLSIVLMGIPSFQRFVQAAEQADETEWRNLKRELMHHMSLVRPSILGITLSSLIVLLFWPEPQTPGTAFQRKCFLSGGLLSALSLASYLGAAWFLNTVQPQVVREMRTSKLRLTAISILLGMPSFWNLLSIYSYLIGVCGAFWLDNCTFMTVMTIVVITFITVMPLVTCTLLS